MCACLKAILTKRTPFKSYFGCLPTCTEYELYCMLFGASVGKLRYAQYMNGS